MWAYTRSYIPKINHCKITSNSKYKLCVTMMPTLVKISNKEGNKKFRRAPLYWLRDSQSSYQSSYQSPLGGPLQSEDFDHPPQPRFPAAPAPAPTAAVPTARTAGTGLLPHSLAGLARIFIICRCCRGLACKQTHFSIFICNHPVIGWLDAPIWSELLFFWGGGAG